MNVDLDKNAFTVKLVEKDRTYDFMQLTHKAFIDDYQHQRLNGLIKLNGESVLTDAMLWSVEEFKRMKTRTIGMQHVDSIIIERLQCSGA